jgi:predicted ATPase/DNA-binding CsgD family transcriptional regulator/Tfp pilus assembly protein PilF
VVAPLMIPAQLTTFIGREREIEKATRLLDESRLLTIVGPGGSGKTRLAVQVVAGLSDIDERGAHFVDLAPLTDPALIPQAVTLATGLRERGDRPLLDTLAAQIGERSILIILDNCEHLVEGCAALTSYLLERCPNLRIMATSREPLGVAGEMLLRIPALKLPDDPDEGIPRRGLPPIEVLGEYESVRLFVERARYKRPGFELSPQNADPIARLCRSLDGMPLAIELAAARTSVLSPEEILARLDRRFSLLTEGGRGAPTRHQTLRGAIDWSYSLLDEDERALLRRLSVFVGSFSLEAVLGVCASANVGGWDEFRVIDLIAGLADKSLVAVEEGRGETRYRLLDTIRGYASEKLEAAGEAPEVRDRHLCWHLDLAERARPNLQGPNQKLWLDRLQAEYANIRLALRWARSRDEEGCGDGESLRFMAALWRFWYVRCYYTEGRGWLEWALAEHPDMPLGSKALALYGLATLLAEQGNMEQAVQVQHDSLDLYKELEDRQGISYALTNLASMEQRRGNFDVSKRLLHESIEIKREMGNRLGVAGSLNNLGNALDAQGDYRQAREVYTESLQIMREVGEKRGIAYTLNNLGHVNLRMGDYADAIRQIEESLSVKRELDDTSGLAMSLCYLGEVEMYRQNFSAARQQFEATEGLLRDLDEKLFSLTLLSRQAYLALYEGQVNDAQTLLDKAIKLAQETGAREYVPLLHLCLGRLTWKEGRKVEATALLNASLSKAGQLGLKDVLSDGFLLAAHITDERGAIQRSAVLIGAANRLLEETGYKPHPLDEEANARLKVAVETKLGPARWAAAQADGRALDLEDAVALATSDLPAAPESNGRAPKYPMGLTRREVEVLRLIARGQTDAEIAENLIISPNTVHAHIHSIYGKLDVTSRAGAIRFALDNTLT